MVSGCFNLDFKEHGVLRALCRLDVEERVVACGPRCESALRLRPSNAMHTYIELHENPAHGRETVISKPRVTSSVAEASGLSLNRY